MTTTLSLMQAGTLPPVKFIALIEGCKYVLTDCNNTSAVQTALAGTDWASATIIPWLRVDLHNEQSITPLDAFVPNMSRCQLRVGDPDRSDTFGTYIHRRLTGAETELASTADRNDTTITVKSTTGFTSSGDIFIGTECCGYGGTTATTFTSVTRGKYSPFGCASSGSGGTRFANHHRVSNDANHATLRPVVSQLPRTWVGKRVGVWLHTWSEATSTLNTRADAQMVFAGRLVGIADDPNTFETVLDLEPFLEEVRSGVIGKDMWSATIEDGLELKTGRVFSFVDWKAGSSIKTANTLTVVASGASGANQCNAGIYSLEELCGVISNWLASEKTASRIYGFYTFTSPATTNAGLRTKCFWQITDASTISCGWGITMPGEVFAFLGLGAQEPGQTGQTMTWGPKKSGRTNESAIAQGESVPFRQLVMKPYAGSRIGQEFSEQLSYAALDERGTFVDQYSLLPAAIKDACSSSYQWGLFLLDEKTLMVGSYASGTLTNCWLSPYQLTADKDAQAQSYIGRRADEAEGGPVTLRQVYLFEASFSKLLLTLLYSSGTSGYNASSTYDSLGYGIGLGLPGGLLSDDFERTVSAAPGKDMPLSVLVDEPTKLEDLLGADFKIRRLFFVWKDQSLRLSQWKTPTLADSVANLTEANKQAPSGQQVNHRTPSQEAQLTQRPVVKIDYSLDRATGRDGVYLKSVTIEDQTAVDDLGGNVKPETIKLKNTLAQYNNTGASVEALIPGFMAFMPCVSRPWRALSRSIDYRFFEGYAPGAVIESDDDFARDPVLGTRGISSRPAVITKLWYDLGGTNADGSIRNMDGGCEFFFLDCHRSELYAPSADVDDTYSSGGYTNGYNNGTATLRCYANHYSLVQTLTTNRGHLSLSEANDATWFNAGDKVLIVERDPADPASPIYWERTVQSQTGDDITLTAALSAPAFDSTKRYRIVPQKYSQVVADQQDYCYQADDADFQVEDLSPAFHPAVTEEVGDPVNNASADFGIKGEFVPAMSYGDGRSYDVGHERALINTANAFIDYVSAHQAPCLWWEYTDDTNNNAQYLTIWCGIVFFGTEHLPASCTRTVTVAPWFRSASAGNTGKIRVTLSRSPPVTGSGSDVSGSVGLTAAARFIDAYSQAEWTTTSATWSTGSDATLSLGVKDLQFGYAFITIEKYGYGQTRGLAKFVEGARTVT